MADWESARDCEDRKELVDLLESQEMKDLDDLLESFEDQVYSDLLDDLMYEQVTSLTG